MRNRLSNSPNAFWLLGNQFYNHEVNACSILDVLFLVKYCILLVHFYHPYYMGNIQVGVLSNQKIFKSIKFSWLKILEIDENSITSRWWNLIELWKFGTRVFLVGFNENLVTLFVSGFHKPSLNSKLPSFRKLDTPKFFFWIIRFY